MTDPTLPVLPTVHLNGSGRERLYDGYHAAYKATVAARDALVMTEFHPRDYYVTDGAFPRARLQRAGHLHRLDEVITYLEAHVAHLAPAPAGDTP